MKQLLCLLLLCLSFSAEAQDIKNFYIQSNHPEGFLYFVRPQKMPEKAVDKKLGAAPMSYDYTYLDSRDSVTLLTTVITKEILKPDTLQVTSGSNINKYPLELIFCEPSKKSDWIYRLSAKMSYEDWTRIYSSPVPFELKFSSSESNKQIYFEDKSSKWKKTSARFVRLHEIIRMNRKK